METLNFMDVSRAVRGSETLSAAEFRDHIKRLCLGANYIRPANPLVTRTPKHEGYNKPKGEKQ